MLTDFPCPVCSVNDWEKDVIYRYAATEHQPGGAWHGHPYVELRRRVLFERWFRSAETVQLQSQFCRQCGFMCYSPRPEPADLEAKYAFLQAVEIDVGGQRNLSSRGIKNDLVRARRLCRTMEQFAPISEASLLDVGGGDGKLLAPFIERGCICHLVDYNPNPKPGVQRLGNTLDDISANQKFDLITCSHVLEHVAEPVQFVAQLKNVLKPGGKAYFEVPLEIWNNIPISSEPVTHINFFTQGSIRAALCRAGLTVLQVKTFINTYGDTRIQAVWSMTENSPTPGVTPGVTPGDSLETRWRLAPRPQDILQRALFVEPRLECSFLPIARLPLRILRRAIRRSGILKN